MSSTQWGGEYAVDLAGHVTLQGDDEPVEFSDLVVDVEDSAGEGLQGELGRDHRVSIADRVRPPGRTGTQALHAGEVADLVTHFLSEPKQKGFARWHGDDAARRAVTNNRTRLLSGVAREAFKLRAEIVERSFAHNLDRGGMRRTWLRGRENVHKRYLLHVADHNLSLLMRQLIGAGTPKEAVAGGIGALFVLVTPAGAVLVVQIVLIVSEDGETAFAAICFAVA